VGVAASRGQCCSRGVANCGIGLDLPAKLCQSVGCNLENEAAGRARTLHDRRFQFMYHQSVRPRPRPPKHRAPSVGQAESFLDAPRPAGPWFWNSRGYSHTAKGSSSASPRNAIRSNERGLCFQNVSNFVEKLQWDTLVLWSRVDTINGAQTFLTVVYLPKYH
jgi:hypothetical protein